MNALACEQGGVVYRQNRHNQRFITGVSRRDYYGYIELSSTVGFVSCGWCDHFILATDFQVEFLGHNRINTGVASPGINQRHADEWTRGILPGGS